MTDMFGDLVESMYTMTASSAQLIATAPAAEPVPTAGTRQVHRRLRRGPRPGRALRAPRARLRAHLQGDPDGQLRAGRDRPRRAHGSPRCCSIDWRDPRRAGLGDNRYVVWFGASIVALAAVAVLLGLVIERLIDPADDRRAAVLDRRHHARSRGSAPHDRHRRRQRQLRSSASRGAATGFELGGASISLVVRRRR